MWKRKIERDLVSERRFRVMRMQEWAEEKARDRELLTAHVRERGKVIGAVAAIEELMAYSSSPSSPSDEGSRTRIIVNPHEFSVDLVNGEKLANVDSEREEGKTAGEASKPLSGW